ncbi:MULTISPECIES: maleylpyruvate isomerase family mycothiol-dependent enzyme [unclassified Streptomyces]|uniref:maleylpyruvate isomerase family mycothiol-dependent enzyme n=1 Tax=unclassified Streptomyces TaxID=2593676 RepID=UPI000996BD3F|nr:MULTISPECIES: maleylpyruvate isomerase family mycothiol-dependent enzyme [unclassified Streptomyces]
MKSAAVDVRAEIAAERRELADVLDGLTDHQWDAPTLCSGWRVREVAAHMSMGFRYSFGRTALELARSGGNLHRMTDRVARRDAAVRSSCCLPTGAGSQRCAQTTDADAVPRAEPQSRFDSC